VVTVESIYPKSVLAVNINLPKKQLFQGNLGQNHGQGFFDLYFFGFLIRLLLCKYLRFAVRKKYVKPKRELKAQKLEDLIQFNKERIATFMIADIQTTFSLSALSSPLFLAF
jgi:hypothetical protein